MKKLYTKKGKIHPSPPPIGDRLSLLPAAVFTLAAALSPQDKEVLAYLISCCGSRPTSGNFSDHPKTIYKGGGGGDHVPLFHCCCFRCYMRFWARWDASPNRQIIHEIIEAYEEGLVQSTKIVRKKKKKKQRGNRVFDESMDGERSSGEESVRGELESADCGGGDEVDGGSEVGLEKGSVRKIVGFIGERIWGVWNGN